MKNNILLTGKPGIGKTTAIRTVVNELGSSRVAGFLSGEIREKGRRVGFRIETLSGKLGILAHVNQRVGPKVSKYRVNIEDIDSIMVSEMKMARESSRIIIIDEIAKMELYSQNFVNEVRKCLDTRQVLGTIQERRLTFLNEIRAREDVLIIKLTPANRDRVPLQLLDLFKEQTI